MTEYLGGLDFTILTSISEGQPLTILEGHEASHSNRCWKLLGTVVRRMMIWRVGNSDAHHEREGDRGCHGESCQTSGPQKTDGEKRLPPCDGKGQDFFDMQQTYRKIYEMFENIDW